MTEFEKRMRELTPRAVKVINEFVRQQNHDTKDALVAHMGELLGRLVVAEMSVESMKERATRQREHDVETVTAFALNSASLAGPSVLESARRLRQGELV